LPEPEYIFKHVIVQQVTYRTLLGDQRRRLHLLAAETLEQLFPDRREELAGILAEHYSAAGENHKAIAYFIEAAGRAEEVYAYEEALHFLKSAQKLGESVSMELEQRMLLLERLADIHALLSEGEEAILLYRETLDLFQSLDNGDKWIAVRQCRKIGRTWLQLHTSERQEPLEAEVQANLKMGLELIADEAPHKEAIRLLARTSFYVYWHKPSADWETAEHYAQVAIEMAEQLDAPVELSDALDALALASNRRAQPRDYLLLEQRRERLSRDPRFDDLPEKLDILVENALALKMVGDHARAIPLFLEAEALAAQMQETHQQVRTLYLQAECWFRLDRWDEVLLAEERAQALQRRYPLNRLGAMCWLLAFSSSVHALRGEKVIAQRLADESYTIMFGVSGGDESNWHSGPYY
jgi:tetratricopeptide (TPR) repeat protein